MITVILEITNENLNPQPLIQKEKKSTRSNAPPENTYNILIKQPIKVFIHQHKYTTQFQAFLRPSSF